MCVCVHVCVSLGLTASLLLPSRVNEHIRVYHGDTTQCHSRPRANNIVEGDPLGNPHPPVPSHPFPTDGG